MKEDSKEHPGESASDSLEGASKVPEASRNDSSDPRLRMESLLRLNADLEVLLAATNLAALVLDAELTIRSFTAPIAAALGIGAADVGRPIREFASALGANLESEAEAVLRSGRPVERRTAERAGRRQFVIRVAPHGLQRPPERLILTVAEEDEVRSGAEAGHLQRRNMFLRQLSRGLARVEQKERKRLARALHDDLQQVMAAAKIRIDLAEAHVSDPLGRAHLASASESLEEAVRASRVLAVELSPPILDSAPLPRALAWLARWVRETHHLEVTLEEEAPVPPLSEDSKKSLFHAARELLVNVVKHAEASSCTVRIAPIGDDWVELIVSDDGLGFEPEGFAGGAHPSHARTLETGLGLSYLREEIEGLGGRIQVESAPGRGTSVRLLAPADGEEVALAAGVRPGAAPESGDAGGRPAAPGETVRVLVVDDHRIVREGISAMLNSQAGIEVVAEARDGREALATAAAVCPDVVLLDVDLPDMSGIEVTRLIKSRLPDVKVIGLSIHQEEEVASSMKAAGAADFLTKGCHPVLLYRRVRAVARDAGRG